MSQWWRVWSVGDVVAAWWWPPWLVAAAEAWSALVLFAARQRNAELIAAVDIRLKRLGEELGDLPPGNLLALFDEIRRLYPPVYDEFRAARDGAIDRLFKRRWPWPPGKA